jgi:hypothetical protein
MKNLMALLLTLGFGINSFAQTATPAAPDSLVVCVGVEQPVQIIVGLDSAKVAIGASFIELDPQTGDVVGGFDFNLSNLKSDDKEINIEGGLDLQDGSKLAIDIKSVYSKDATYKDEQGNLITYGLYEGLANFIVNGQTDTIKVACYNE